MTQARPTPSALLTIPEVARLLHVSSDTVRRQIREGDLPAVRIGTTPAGRPRYRISSQEVQSRLRQETPTDPLEPLRAVFDELNDAQRETLLAEAIAWAKQRLPAVSTEGRLPQPSAERLRARFAERHKRFEDDRPLSLHLISDFSR